jgi:hypothetical protein
VWIAPSGGRDRPDADGHWTPDPFDPTAVELMASLIGRAKKPGHLYPMAMYSYPIMPPPKKVHLQRGVGGGVEMEGGCGGGGVSSRLKSCTPWVSIPALWLKEANRVPGT